MWGALIWGLSFGAIVAGFIAFMAHLERREEQAKRAVDFAKIEGSLDSLEASLTEASDEDLAAIFGADDPSADTTPTSAITGAQAMLLSYAHHHGQIVGDEAGEEDGYRLPATGAWRTLNSLVRRNLLSEARPGVWRLTAAGKRAVFDLGKIN